MLPLEVPGENPSLASSMALWLLASVGLWLHRVGRGDLGMHGHIALLSVSNLPLPLSCKDTSDCS